MTYIHDTVIREYLSGKVIQLLMDDNKWVDLPVYGTEDNIPLFLNSLKYRVKPSFKYYFFHCTERFNLKENKDYINLNMSIFKYPENKPAGAHIMVKTFEGKVVETKHSETNKPAYKDEQIS